MSSQAKQWGYALERKLSAHFHKAVAHLDIGNAKVLVGQHGLCERLPYGRFLESQAQVACIRVIERNQRMIEDVEGGEAELQPLSSPIEKFFSSVTSWSM